MKKALAVLLVLSLVSAFAITVFAHPGKTDGNGGHTDNSTGEYHYHHGYPEHDHKDIDGDGDIDCPYDFDDKTNSFPDPENASNVSRSANEFISQISDSYNSYVPNEKELHISAGTVASYFFSSLLTIVFCAAPIFLLIYYILFLVVHFLVHSILRLFIYDDDMRDQRATVLSNGLLFFVSFFFLLFPLARFLSSNPEALATVLIYLAIILFVSAWVIASLIRTNDDLDNRLRKVENDHSEAVSEFKKRKQCYEQQIEDQKNQIIILTNQLNKIQDSHQHVYDSISKSYQNKISQLEKTISELSPHSEDESSAVQLSMFDIDAIRKPVPKISLPVDVYFADDGTPVRGKISANRLYGDFTAYISTNGTVYHSDPYCASYLAYPVHVFDVIDKRRPCAKCGKHFGNAPPDWYRQLKQLAEEIKT